MRTLTCMIMRQLALIQIDVTKTHGDDHTYIGTKQVEGDEMFEIRTFSVRMGARRVLSFASSLLSATFVIVSAGLVASALLPQMHASAGTLPSVPICTL